MYIVKLDNEFFSGFGKFYLKDYEIFQPVLESRVNDVGHFSFTVYHSHPLYQNADIPKKLLTVSRFNQSQPIFTGRLSEVETGLYNEKILTFESEEAFLLDSVITDFYSTMYKAPSVWLSDILSIHNNHNGTYGNGYSVNISRKFQLGKTSEILKTSRIATT